MIWRYMHVKIINIKTDCISSHTFCATAPVCISPERNYAVVRVIDGSVFIGATIISSNNDHLLCGYKCHCFSEYDADMQRLSVFTVDWRWMQYGFCKIRIAIPSSGSKKTLHRLYFDWNLYKKKYEEVNDVPYIVKNPIHTKTKENHDEA